MRYEKQFKSMEKDPSKRAALLKDLKSLMERMDAALARKPGEYQDLLHVMRQIADYLLSEYDNMKKEVDKIMGGRVLPLPSDALRRAEARGEAKGKMVGLIYQIQRKIKREKSLVEICEELEETEEVIKPLFDAVQRCGEDCTAEEIYHKLAK